jgi:hypothetical protein
MGVRFCEEAFDVLTWYLCQMYPSATLGYMGRNDTYFPSDRFSG